MTDGLTERGRAFLAASHLREAVEDLSAAQINAMSMADYAEIRRRVGLDPIDPYATAYSTYRPPAPTRAPAPAPTQPPAPAAPEMPGIDITNLSMTEYAAYRQQAGIGQSRQYGRGILDGAGTDAWAAAARAGAGRTALSQSNLQEAPRLDGRYLNPDEHRDTRTRGQRFNTPGNAWQG